MMMTFPMSCSCFLNYCLCFTHFQLIIFLISKIIFSESVLFKKGTVASNLPLDQEKFSVEDLESLIELNPPSVMPNGNVGTKTEHFLKEIRACRLPPSLISKLGLQFPRNRSRKIYASVPFDYVKKKKRGEKPEPPPKHEISSHKTPWRPLSKTDETPFNYDENEEVSIF